MKECGDCDECCKGTLTGDVYGHQMGKGISCHFFKEHKCGIYKDRPHMCKEYECFWKLDPNIPDFMKPNISKIIITQRNAENFYYLDVTATVGNELNAESISHIIRYAVLTGKNIVWRKNNYERDVKVFFLGSPEFMAFAAKDTGKL